LSVSVVGVDLGGTKVAVELLVDGQVAAPGVLRPTQLSSSAALIEQLVELVQYCRPGRLDGVGIGVPSVIEWETGKVISSVNIPLANVALRDVLGERLGVPVFVDNDATVAALAEAHDEKLRLVSSNLVMITIGTGVGGGLVLGGRIYRGSRGGAAELGHTIVALPLQGEDPVPTASHFPQPGSFEAVASGHALDRLASEAARLYPDSALGQRVAEGKPVLGPEVVEAAQAGDPDLGREGRHRRRERHQHLRSRRGRDRRRRGLGRRPAARACGPRGALLRAPGTGPVRSGPPGPARSPRRRAGGRAAGRPGARARRVAASGPRPGDQASRPTMMASPAKTPRKGVAR
jgi:predicted NBD/HSP70 family sugar kinase